MARQQVHLHGLRPEYPSRPAGAPLAILTIMVLAVGMLIARAALDPAASATHRVTGTTSIAPAPLTVLPSTAAQALPVQVRGSANIRTAPTRAARVLGVTSVGRPTTGTATCVVTGDPVGARGRDQWVRLTVTDRTGRERPGYVHESLVNGTDALTRCR